MERKKHTILVVDDEADIVRSVQDLLRKDWKVIGTTKATEALELMKGEEVHVIMSDQRMPGMTGVEFLSQARGDHPDAIRLLFTGYADIHAVIDAINQGNVYRYITKPWDPDELQAILRQAAERYDMIVERKRLYAELETKNKQLQSANAELEKASMLKSAFIKVVSHELRTPVAILTGLSKLGLATGDLPGTTRDVLTRLDRASQRLNSLVDQIISMMSLEQYDTTVQRTTVDLPALLKEAADDVRPFLELRKQVLKEVWSDNLGSAQIDPAQIRDCLNHLLLNAIKFTPDGGQIELAAKRLPDEQLEIKVIDSGDGMSAEVASHLFEPFFTGFDVSRHSTGKFEYGRKGLGLGLSVVKAFVTMHGGQVSVQSELGHGSTFTVVLPSNPPALTIEEPLKSL
ncbi:MAG: hybrid sensor histidine kinase/response regulator [Phycisphaerae bacterium]|nr:hybrid sensor histidine kinase/response regulator [Phycisphaerae bacterium]